MNDKFASIVIIVLLIAVNIGLMLQYQQELDEHHHVNQELEYKISNLSSDLAIFQQAWAQSLCQESLTTSVPKNHKEQMGGTFAIRITDHQCSSCVDEALVQIHELLSQYPNQNLIVLYSSKQDKKITLPYRIKMMRGTPFIRVENHALLGKLDDLNLPYLMYLSESGEILSSFLAYNTTKNMIDTYLKHTINQINSKHEKEAHWMALSTKSDGIQLR